MTALRRNKVLRGLLVPCEIEEIDRWFKNLPRFEIQGPFYLGAVIECRLTSVVGPISVVVAEQFDRARVAGGRDFASKSQIDF